MSTISPLKKGIKERMTRDGKKIPDVGKRVIGLQLQHQLMGQYVQFQGAKSRRKTDEYQVKEAKNKIIHFFCTITMF